MKKITVTTALIALLACPFALAAQPMLKLTIKGFSNAETSADMSLNLPFSMLEAMRPTIQEALENIHIEGHDIDLKAIWQEVKNAGPNDFVEITEADGTVRISTTETHLVIQVDKEDEQVDMSMPLALGDAFLSYGQVDFDTVMDALLALRGQELLNIKSDNGEIKAWIE